MIELDDGSYDVFVVEAVLDPARGDLHLELAIVSGARRGDVVRVRAEQFHRDPLDLLGLPGTLLVIDGQPTFELD